MIPPNMDREEFAKRKRLGADYLSRIARATGEKRQELIVEWAEKLYDAHAQSRMRLVKSSGDIPRLQADFALFVSGTVMPMLAEARPDDRELEAIRLAIAGRASEWLARIIQGLPAEGVVEGPPSRAAKGARAGSKDPIALQRRARVDDYIDEVSRIKKKHILRSAIWKTAGYENATAFERWQRNDPRSTKAHDRSFARVLTERPHLK
jgi:hypothetical protein